MNTETLPNIVQTMTENQMKMMERMMELQLQSDLKKMEKQEELRRKRRLEDDDFIG